MMKNIDIKKCLRIALIIIAIPFTVTGVLVVMLYISGNQMYGVKSAYEIYSEEGLVRIEGPNEELVKKEQNGMATVCSGLQYKKWCLGHIETFHSDVW